MKHDVLQARSMSAPGPALYGAGRAGRWRTVVLSAAFATLFGTGLHLEFFAAYNWRAGELVLWCHIGLGMLFTGFFANWIGSHVSRNLAHVQRSLFSWSSWLLLADYVVVLVTGLAMVLPTALYLGGHVWYWRFETTGILTFLHLWSAVATAPALLVHLALRHWRIDEVRQTGGRS
jgi:hypothetical protein